MADTKHRRRRYLINRSFQLRWTGALLLVAVGAAVITAPFTVFVYLFFVARDAAPTTEQLILLLTIWVGLLGVFLVYAGIRMSHRTAGPMYHIQRSLEKVRGGDFSERIQLRRTDYWHDLAATFNRMMDELAKRCGQQDDEARQLRALAQAAAQRHPDDADLAKIVEMLGETLDTEEKV